MNLSVFLLDLKDKVDKFKDNFCKS